MQIQILETNPSFFFHFSLSRVKYLTKYQAAVYNISSSSYARIPSFESGGPTITIFNSISVYIYMRIYTHMYLLCTGSRVYATDAKRAKLILYRKRDFGFQPAVFIFAA